MSFLLFGSHTSPYVRRVRVFAIERDLPYEMIDTSLLEGQKRLREVSPVWKVPVAKIDDHLLLDSHSIIEYILKKRGYGPLRSSAPAQFWREKNLLTVIDASLESAINAFYFEKDKADPNKIPYLKKQKMRVDAGMKYLEKELQSGWFTLEKKLGLSEIYFYTALDWMRFRLVYPVEQVPAFAEFIAIHKDRESIFDTAINSK